MLDSTAKRENIENEDERKRRDATTRGSNMRKRKTVIHGQQ